VTPQVHKGIIFPCISLNVQEMEKIPHKHFRYWFDLHFTLL